MNISLTKKLEELVREKVASGLYNNASEVMREALRLLARRDEMGHLYEDWLVAEIAIGWDQLDRGEVRSYDMATIIEQARANP